jgi:tetratricopeptide (TPR) repeat protein
METLAEKYFNEGVYFAKSGRHAEAVASFDKAIAIEPNDTVAWYNKSLALVHPGEETEALRALDQVLTLNPEDNDAQSRRALIVRKMAQDSETARTDSPSAQSQLRV